MLPNSCHPLIEKNIKVQEFINQLFSLGFKEFKSEDKNLKIYKLLIFNECYHFEYSFKIFLKDKCFIIKQEKLKQINF